MDDPTLADEIIDEITNLPKRKQTKAAQRLLAVATHLQKSNIRTQAEEQVRARARFAEKRRRKIDAVRIKCHVSCGHCPL